MILSKYYRSKTIPRLFILRPSLIFLFLNLRSARTMSSSRDRMIAEVSQGGEMRAGGDASDKIILGRGCDPIMAERSQTFLPPMLGNAMLISVTDDDDFIKQLKERKFNVIFFAPGACRYNAVKRPIPGGNEKTSGWSLQQYRELVKDLQGPDAVIVESTEEREVVPLLRKALKLPV